MRTLAEWQTSGQDLEVVALHLEPELVNGQLRLIMTTADGEKYMLSERTICPEGGQGQLICKKQKTGSSIQLTNLKSNNHETCRNSFRPLSERL